MQPVKRSKGLMPVIAGKVRDLAEPLVRELEGLKPPEAPGRLPVAKGNSSTAKAGSSATSPKTLTGWSTKDLMAAVRELLKSGRAVARGRFLNLRV